MEGEVTSSGGMMSVAQCVKQRVLEYFSAEAWNWTQKRRHPLHMRASLFWEWPFLWFSSDGKLAG